MAVLFLRVLRRSRVFEGAEAKVPVLLRVPSAVEAVRPVNCCCFR